MIFCWRRQSLHAGHAKEITIREDAPEGIRVVAFSKASELGISDYSLRAIVCDALRRRPNPDNWSVGNVEREAEYLFYGCEWFKVYDIIEAIYASLLKADQRHYGGGQKPGEFAAALNAAFIEEGIGWQITDGKSLRDRRLATNRVVAFRRILWLYFLLIGPTLTPKESAG